MHVIRHDRRSGFIPLTLVALTLSLWLSIAGPSMATAQETTPTATATAPGVLGTAVPTTTCDPQATATAAASGSNSYTLVSDTSEARYRAQEELASIGANEAVGKTKAIIGTILLDADKTPLACSRFDVDLRTLTSDQARRDNYLYSNTLETGQFPLATFVLTGIEGLNGPLPDGKETAVTLVGNLSVHGVTKLVAWEATVKLDGDALTGTAKTSFKMPDFDITPPVIGQVVSIDDTIGLEVDLSATKSS